LASGNFSTLIFSEIKKEHLEYNDVHSAFFPKGRKKENFQKKSLADYQSTNV